MNKNRFIWLLLTIGLSCYLFIFWHNNESNGSPKPAAPDQVSESHRFTTFENWIDNYVSSSKKPDNKQIEEGVYLARQRMRVMQDLIRSNPADALGSALPENVREVLPDEIKPYVEKHISTIADIGVAIACGPGIAEIDIRTDLPDGTHFTTFVTPGNGYNRSRKNVLVEGIHLGDVGALWNNDEQDADISVLDQSLQKTAALAGSPRLMYIILVNFDRLGGTPVSDPNLLSNLVNGDVSQQISEMSYGKTWISCEVNPTIYTLSQMPDYYNSMWNNDKWMMYDEAIAMVEADGINLSGYDTVALLFPYTGRLSFSGYADLPGKRMYLNGYNSDSKRVITHELGHNLGSYHASAWNTVSSDPADPAGSSIEYGDPLDIMGSGGLPKGHFHIQNKLQVGWLDLNNIAYVGESGTYRVYRTDHPGTDPGAAVLRGLKIDKDQNEYYWIGYRQQYPEFESHGRGVHVLWQQFYEDGWQKSHLLDMTPGTAGGHIDGGLAMGVTYSDTQADVHITPVMRGGYPPNEYMDVVVNLGTQSGNSPPVASISGPTAGMTNETLGFKVEAWDPDGDELCYAWDFGDGVVMENAPIAYHSLDTVGAAMVRCTVSDMKGGSDTVEIEVTLSHALETWTDHGPIFATNLNDIAVGNDILVTVGDHGYVGTSTDGESWNHSNLGVAWYYDIQLESIIYAGNKFIAAGNKYDTNSASWHGVILESPDAANWTQVYQAGSSTIQLYDVAYGNGVSIAVGTNTTILRSGNGGAWNPINVTTGNADLKSVTFTNTAFTTVGDNAGNRVVLYSNTQGFLWYNRTNYSGTTTIPFNNVESYNGVVLASCPSIGIRYSPNEGYNFLDAAAGLYDIPAFAFGAGVYLAAGVQYGSSTDMNLVSGDGKNWMAIPTASQNDRAAAVFYKNCFITVGTGGAVWKSQAVSNASAGWANWQGEYISVLSINRDTSDDADMDGVENVLEYALGSDPGDPSSVPAIHSSKDETGYLYITIPRQAVLPNITYTVEQNVDLENAGGWDSLPTTEVSNTETGLIYRTTEPVNVTSPQFLRLRVEFASP